MCLQSDEERPSLEEEGGKERRCCRSLILKMFLDFDLFLFFLFLSLSYIWFYRLCIDLYTVKASFLIFPGNEGSVVLFR